MNLTILWPFSTVQTGWAKQIWWPPTNLKHSKRFVYNIINNYKQRKIATFRTTFRAEDTTDILISRRLEIRRKPFLVIWIDVVSCIRRILNAGFFLSLKTYVNPPPETGADDAFLKLRTKPNFVHLVMYLLCTCYVLKDHFSFGFCYNIQLLKHCIVDYTPCQPWLHITKKR